MRLCEFNTTSRSYRNIDALELFAWARYKRGDTPTTGEYAYINNRVTAEYPNAELVEMRRRFVPTANGMEPTEAWWEFRWIDFTHKKKGTSA